MVRKAQQRAPLTAPAVARGRNAIDRFAGDAHSVRLGRNRLVLKSPELFDDDDRMAHRLVARTFTLPEVQAVIVRRERGLIDIELQPLADAPQVWRRLGALLRNDRAADEPALAERAAALNLHAPAPGLPVRITRSGNVLTTFRVRALSSETLRLSHPLLRRRDVMHRLRETLASLHGVTDVRATALRASVFVGYDPDLIEADQILRLLDASWSQFIEGIAPPAAPKKLVIAGGLLAFASIAQFVNPALLPWATAAVALYSFPNLVAALRDLAKRRIGLPALYSAGLGFLLWSRLPFASGVMATLSQSWPELAQRLAARSERRLFTAQRRRLVWARLQDANRGDIAIDLDRIEPGAVVIARAGDYVPVDGIVVEGLAAVDEGVLTGARCAADKSVGDAVYAGTHVLDGSIAVRTQRVGAATASAALARALPRGALTGLPSIIEADRIANRNAKPALAFAALALLATRTPRLSQSIIRPDYATAPRLSAHLSALAVLNDALAAGALVRNPAALDRLMAADVYIFDDSVDFAELGVGVATVQAETRAAARETVALAVTALSGIDDPRSPALLHEALRRRITATAARGHRRLAGAIRFKDEEGALITAASPIYARNAEFVTLSSAHAEALNAAAAPGDDGALRPLVIARGREMLGVISFTRREAGRVSAAVSAIRARNPQIRFVHLSSAPQEEAEARVSDFGFDAVFGGLGPLEKGQAVRSLSSRAIWIGDGADSETSHARAACAVSVSLAGLASLPDDAADVVLLRRDLDALIATLGAAHKHFARLKGDYRTVYLANIAAVAGGFLAGFGSLQAGLTSNLGTAAVFLSRWRDLAQSTRRFGTTSAFD